MLLKEIFIKWADDLVVTGFNCSDGYITITLKVHDMSIVRLNGEDDEITDDYV